MLLDISILEFLMSESILTALILTALGFSSVLLAPRIAKRVKGKDADLSKSKACLILRCFGLCLMIAGILIIGIVCFKRTLNI